jgi:hypothetical protein
MTVAMIEVQREPNESNASLIRRFSKRVSGAAIVPMVKKLKFHERELSPLKKKRSALKRLARQAEYRQLKKLGKLPKSTRGPRRR